VKQLPCCFSTLGALQESIFKKMFCHICGVETPDCSNFCWKCSASARSKKAEEDKKKPVSFMAFKKRKEEERSSRFQPEKKLKSGSNSTLKEKGKEDTQVSINVGYMKFEGDKFKKCRGRTLPVKVPVTADRKTILERSICKHVNHFKDVHENLEYTLIYPDNSEIVRLPGTEQFVLNKYREDVGRNYNRITIFIATKTDYINYHLFEIGESLEAESSDNNHGSEDDDDRIIDETMNNAHSSQHDRRLRQAKWKQTTLDEVSGPSTSSTLPSTSSTLPSTHGDEQRPSTSSTLPSTHDGDEQRQSSVQNFPG
jgi:hypothetical protein